MLLVKIMIFLVGAMAAHGIASAISPSARKQVFLDFVSAESGEPVWAIRWAGLVCNAMALATALTAFIGLR